jgi:DNA repair photolyase
MKFYIRKDENVSDSCLNLITSHVQSIAIGAGDDESFDGQTVKTLWLAHNKGKWLRSVCNYFSLPNAYSLEIAEGCPYACMYCILQAYLSHRALKVFVNFIEELDSINNAIESCGSNAFISTGITADSLLVNSLFPYCEGIIYIAKKNPHAVIELRSKTAKLDLVPPNHLNLDNLIISWTMSSPYIISQTEKGVASFEQRLQAAVQACRLGSRVGFHFDPLIVYSRVRSDYDNLLQRLFACIPHQHIAYLSLGALRFPEKFLTVIQQRHRRHWIFKEEFVPVYKETYSYLRPLRKALYAMLIQQMRQEHHYAGRILIMESDHAFARLL